MKPGAILASAKFAKFAPPTYVSANVDAQQIKKVTFPF